MTLRRPLALAVLAALSACGWQDRLPGVGAAAAVPAGAPGVEVQAQDGAAAAFALVAQRAGIQSLSGPGGRTLALQDGLIVSAKGFPEALMAANAGQSARLIRAGQAGTAERFHSYLTGDDRTEVRTYACIIAPEGPESLAIGGVQRATMLMGESCQSLTERFKNQYWIDPHGGAIVQSRQWIGPVTGTLRTRHGPGEGGSP